MKQIFAIGALLLGTQQAFAALEPIEQCLEQTKNWVYRNMPGSAADATRMSLEFCGGGGRSTCLDPAQQWVYRNTARNPATAAEVVINFCKRGDVTCLEPAKQWIYRNGGMSPVQAAEAAVKTCAERLVCEPVERVPGRPMVPPRR